mmetsp:Transcript_9066/g.11320  ORF Transcript_9066/g.11320 Transcript_9066/m.11320 type:complete len:675 (-) Transcript_9066:2002-4026(-)
MQPIYSPSNESAFNYAFALAIKQHLASVESELNGRISESDQTTDTSIKAQDTVYYIQHVKQVIFKKILMHYREEDIKANRTNGSFANSLAYNFEDLLLGPKLSSFDIPKRLKTKEIIEKIERVANKDNSHFWLVAERESELASKFAVLLRNTLKIQKKTLWNEESSLENFDIISAYAAEYLRGLVSNLSEVLQMPQSSIMKLDAVVDELRNGATYPALPLQDLYEGFKSMVISYIEMTSSDKVESNIKLINTLREQGNNLMSSLSYAQAIQIYTNALNLCSLSTANNIAQLLTNRAIAYIGLNCFPEAITDLNEAVDYDRTFTSAWVQLGYCHLYMGTSLIALKCYLMSLKAAIGEILPENFPIDENKDFVVEYQENKLATILPQFVERLIQAVILTEKRAYQQREPTLEIKAAVSNVRSILAKLRASASNEDMQYFTYSASAEDSAFRPTAERLNRTRPSILNQDVAQNMLANSGVEASAITLPATPITSFERITRNRDAPNGQAGANATRQQGPRNAASGMRGFLNDFGDMFEGAGLISIDIPTDNTPDPENRSGDADNTNRGPNEPSSSGATTNASEPRNPPINGRNVVRDVLRGIMPENMAGSIGNILSQSFNSQNGEGHIVLGTQDLNSNQTSRSENAAPAENNTQQRGNSAPRSDEDTDMPEFSGDLD